MELAQLPHLGKEKLVPCIVYIHQIGWSEALYYTAIEKLCMTNSKFLLDFIPDYNCLHYVILLCLMPWIYLNDGFLYCLCYIMSKLLKVNGQDFAMQCVCVETLI